MRFLEILHERQEMLFSFGLLNLVAALVFIVLALLRPMELAGANVWFKPIKFALSTCILLWSVAWYAGYLPAGRDTSISYWLLALSAAFEVIYIAWQAARGEASHFNLSTSFHSMMFGLMGLGATLMTLSVGYMGIKFFGSTSVELPDYYLWAIRLGVLLFVVFAFEGFLMGSRLSHTVGAPDGGPGLPFLNWSMTHGDLRIAHFIGMHALQVLPLMAWFVLKDIRWSLALALAYGLLAGLILWQALRGIPLLTQS